MLTSVTIPEEVARNYGVAATEFRGLSRVVVLAGPNGAGKSRYLRALEATLNRVRTARSDLPGLEEQLAQAIANQDHAQNNLKLLHRVAQSSQREERISKAEANVQTRQQRTATILDRRTKKLATVALASFTGVESGDSEPRHDATTLVQLHYEGGDDKVQDLRQLTQEQAFGLASQVASGGFASAHSAMHAYLASTARVLWSADHPRERERAGFEERLSDAVQFNRIVSALLSTQLECQLGADGHVEPMLRGRPFKKSELSNGEKVLLTWAITLHKQKELLANAVITIDEPENYLHPNACIQALERLQGLLGEHGQIWIATHSVPLIAYGGLESVYLIKDNQAVFARNKVDDVVCSLLGGPLGRTRLQTLLADADSIAANKFLAECLLAPTVVDTGANDPQSSMLHAILERAKTEGKQLRLLDYGAGKGRLATAISELVRASDVEYFAFDLPASAHRDLCLSRIARLQQAAEPAAYYWDSPAKLEAETGRTFDIVVLCNVLHEINPLDWPSVFRKIDHLLRDDGVVIIMEDLLPPIGELPHAGGHLLLDLHGLKTLASAHQGIKLLAAEREGRLIAVEIPKDAISGITDDSRKQAIQYVYNRSREEAERLRSDSSDRTVESGRKHAHFMVQLANATLILERLS